MMSALGHERMLSRSAARPHFRCKQTSPTARLQASPLNTKYCSRSALLQERASKLVAGGGELTIRVDPAIIRCEACYIVRIAAARQHPSKPQNDTQMIWGGYVFMIGRFLHEFPHSLAVRDVRPFIGRSSLLAYSGKLQICVRCHHKDNDSKIGFQFAWWPAHIPVLSVVRCRETSRVQARGKF